MDSSGQLVPAEYDYLQATKGRAKPAKRALAKELRITTQEPMPSASAFSIAEMYSPLDATDSKTATKNGSAQRKNSA